MAHRPRILGGGSEYAVCDALKPLLESLVDDDGAAVSVFIEEYSFADEKKRIEEERAQEYKGKAHYTLLGVLAEQVFF